MNKFMVTYFALAILFTSACSESNGSNGNNATAASAKATAVSPTPVNYTVVSSGVQTGIQNQQLQIITSAEQFASLISITSLSGDIPSVDFSHNELIGVFLGANVGCGTDQISISDLQESESTVTVNASRQVTLRPPGVACTLMSLNGLSYALVTIPKTAKPISLVFN